MNETLLPVEEVKTYLKIIWQHHWLVLLCAIAVCLFGWSVVAVMPNTYQVKATVQVERSAMLLSLLKGIAAESNITGQMMGLMRQIMLARPSLEIAARESGLDQGINSPEKLDRLLEGLAAKVTISGSEGREGVYTVSYQHSVPQTAQRVVKALLDHFSDTILTATRTDMEKTRRFVDQQIQEYRAKMEAAEQKIREFKEQHPDVLEGDKTYYARLETAKNQYESALLELQEAEKEVAAINTGIGASPTSVIKKGKRALDLEIQAVEKNLADLEQKFTDRHPDVIANKRILERLMERKRQGQQSSGPAVDDSDEQIAIANPDYQSWKTQATRASAKVASLKSRVEEYKRRVEELQRSVSTVPKMEVEFARLQREYTFQRDNYQTLIVRRETALVSDKLENANELKLNVLDRPRVPSAPIAPKRLLLNTGVLAASLGAGAGLVILLALLQPRIYSRDDLKKVTDLPVLGSLSLSEVVKPQRSFLAANLSFLLSVTALGLAYVGLNVMYMMQAPFLTRLAGASGLF